MPVPTWIRRIAWAGAALLALAAAGVATAVWLGHRKLDRQVPSPAVADWAIPSDATTVARGAYLYASRGCAECHGANGAGRAFINEPDGFYLKAPNISPGAGSVTASYRAQDWTRLLRHGVKPDGRPAFIMPSEDYARWTQDDLAALVAYVRQLPATGSGLEKRVPVPVMALYGLGAIPDAAEKIGPGPAQPAQPVPAAISLEHGAYVAQMCVGCHGAQLMGGRIPGGPPDWPAAPRLAAGADSVMPRYPDGDSFLRMLRSGRRADGSAVQVMPFETLRQLDEVDARALHLYLSRAAN